MPKLAETLGAARGFYPERAPAEETGADRAVAAARGLIAHLTRPGVFRYRRRTRLVAGEGERLRGWTAEQLAAAVPDLRAELRTRGLGVVPVARTFALVRELSALLLGQRHRDAQVMGGWALVDGCVAGLGAGEGKTLTAILPASAAALAGIPVHVITLNGYLAQRDADTMRPVYEALGLSVGVVAPGSGPDARRAAYGCDVTYCPHKEVVFDYLRDRLELGHKPGRIRMRLERLYKSGGALQRLCLRGLCFGIVDDADSVLLDEARAPVVISGPGDTSYQAEVYEQALELSEQLVEEQDFSLDSAPGDVVLTDAGASRLEQLSGRIGGLWAARLRREDLVRKALKARLFFQRDQHYVVEQGRVRIIDPKSGRVLPGRSWEGGLHQLIEAKECCPVTARTEIKARLSYPRFFRRYLALAGLSGTARDAARELWSIYRLRVVSLPGTGPTLRRRLPTRLFRRAEDKWRAVAARVAEIHTGGRPVLIGTRAGEDSEHLAALLSERGLSCEVLRPEGGEDGAGVLAGAGQTGGITVTTNLAGQGVGIELGPGVAELGGLHVIAAELHDSRRIDRQLLERCARRGEAGSFEFFLSLEDRLLQGASPGIPGLPVDRIDPASTPGRLVTTLRLRRAQRIAQLSHRRARSELIRMEESLDSTLAFSGAGE